MSNNTPEFYLIILWEKCNINPEIVKDNLRNFELDQVQINKLKSLKITL